MSVKFHTHMIKKPIASSFGQPAMMAKKSSMLEDF